MAGEKSIQLCVLLCLSVCSLSFSFLFWSPRPFLLLFIFPNLTLPVLIFEEMNRHHKLLEELGHLKDRERVLIGENDQLRAQLVEMKEQEKKKYDDLMVQYNMKREYEDEGLDSDGMTVKEEIKEEIKEEEDDGLDKQGMTCWLVVFDLFTFGDICTGTSNNQVTVKTEWDHEEVKVEIKEEDEDGCDRCFVKKEEVEDGEETRIIDMETLTQDRQVKRGE